MMRWIVIGCLLTAVSLVGAAFALADYWFGLWFSIMIGAVWLVGVWFGRTWLATLALVGVILTTAVAGVLGLSPITLLTGIALALFAWSMGNVGRRLAAVSDVRDQPELIKTHGLWAGGAVGLGWLLGLIALNVQFVLNFWWALLLGIVVVFALSQFVRRA